MISQRDAFFNRLYDLCKANPDIYLVSADMGAPSLDRFRKDLSRQYIDAGIAEQNAVLIASGLAKMGKKVFVYAIAPFITYRVIEMIRLELCAMNLPITLVGIGAGMGYDDSGPTHHATEDISMLRCLPNLKIHNITDPVMAEAFADISVDLECPNYVRLDRQANDVLYGGSTNFYYGYAPYFSPNKGIDDIMILATGNMVHVARDIQRDLDVNMIDIYEIPFNKSLIKGINGWASNQKTPKLITLEEHVLPGGLGSAVLELLSDNGLQIPVKRFGLDFSEGFCYQYGGRAELQKLYGLDKDSIVREIKKWV